MTGKHTPGPWFVGGVRQKIDRQEAHGIFWYDEVKKRDENIASVWYDPRTGTGATDARLIAAVPELLAALQSLQSFVAVVFGCGPNADMPETIYTPLGVPVKIGAIMRDAAAAIAKAEGTPTPNSTTLLSAVSAKGE